MNIAILDDYQDAVRKLDCAEKLRGHSVKVHTNTVKGFGQLSMRLKDAEALILIRERTHITKQLIERLPNLKLIRDMRNQLFGHALDQILAQVGERGTGDNRVLGEDLTLERFQVGYMLRVHGEIMVMVAIQIFPRRRAMRKGRGPDSEHDGRLAIGLVQRVLCGKRRRNAGSRNVGELGGLFGGIRQARYRPVVVQADGQCDQLGS